MQVFSLFKCIEIQTDEYVLELDPGIKCYDEEWYGMSYAAYAFMIIYVLGIPLGTYMALRSNKAALWDEKHKYHVYYMSAFGNIYEPYLERYYYWDVIEMIRKMIMTGGLILVATGSSAQLLLAEIITLSYMLFVLKLAPFHSNHDDLLSFVTSLQIMLTLMLAFALKTDSLEQETNGAGGSTTYDSHVMGLMMAGLTIAVILCMFFCFCLVMQNLIKDNCSKSKTLMKIATCWSKCMDKVRSSLNKRTRNSGGRDGVGKKKKSKMAVKPVNK